MCDIETLRLFVNERLTSVAEDILAVFVRTLVDYQQQLDLQWRQHDAAAVGTPAQQQGGDSHDGAEEDTAEGRKCTKEWKKLVQKRRRMMGQSYIGKSKGAEVHNEPRAMGPRCQSAACVKSSKFRCSDIEEADRENIFKCFWENMDWEEKRKYVQGLIDVTPVKRRRGSAQRSCARVFFLNVNGERWRVCRSLFLSTLGIKAWSAFHWIQTVDAEDAPEDAGSRDRDFLRGCEGEEDRQKRSHTLVQDEPQPLEIKQEQEEVLLRPEEAAGSTLALLTVMQSEDDIKRDTEPVASTSTQHMNSTQDYGTSQATSEVQLLSSNCSESDVTEDSDEWEPEETSEDQSDLRWSPTSHKTTPAKGQRTSLSNTVPCNDLQSTKQTSSSTTTSRKGKETFSCSKIQRVQGGSFMIHSFKYKQQTVGQYSCTVCGKAFSRNESLKRHMMTHTGEKPFTCPVCSKGCGQMSDLKKHMRSHTGEKPFTCEVCGKKFTRTETLKRHTTLTHTGETPFYCTVCGEQFGQSASLKRHMEIHAGPNPGLQ